MSNRKLKEKLKQMGNSKKNIPRKEIEEHKEAELKIWMKILSIKDLYSNIGNIVPLPLCCFVKEPLKATAESIGSVINQHGYKERASILPSTLSREVLVSWNGPPELRVATTDILEEALKIYFDGKKTGLFEFVNTQQSQVFQ